MQEEHGGSLVLWQLQTPVGMHQGFGSTLGPGAGPQIGQVPDSLLVYLLLL
jgi:hypothetical protein